MLAVKSEPKISSAVYRTLLRLARGERVEPSRGTFGGMSLADDLNRRELVRIEASPKGRKVWYALTDKGRALIPAAEQWQRDDRERSDRLRRENDQSERVYQAGPKCYDYVRALADNGDENAKRFLASLDL